MSTAAHPSPSQSHGPAVREITLSVVKSIDNQPTVVASVPAVNLHDPVRFVPALHSDKIKVEMKINRITGEPDTPFADEGRPVFLIENSKPHKAEKEGVFVFNCTIIRDGEEIGWGKSFGGEIPIPPR
ncbi:MAG: hypothetical protein ACM3SW_00270 [Actinomycetota bacterium]